MVLDLLYQEHRNQVVAPEKWLSHLSTISNSLDLMNCPFARAIPIVSLSPVAIRFKGQVLRFYQFIRSYLGIL